MILRTILCLILLLTAFVYAQMPTPQALDSTSFNATPAPTAEQKQEAADNENAHRVETAYNDPIYKAIDKYWKSRYMKSPQFLLCCLLMAFSSMLFIIYYKLFSQGKLNAYQITRLNLITLIIVGSIFLITAGYDNTQILSAMGLFGTIAGYLLGKSPTVQQNHNPNEESTI